MEPSLRPCDVCVSVFQDARPKEVKYCNLCNAWMCDACRSNWMARTLAATKKAFQR